MIDLTLSLKYSNVRRVNPVVSKINSVIGQSSNASVAIESVTSLVVLIVTLVRFEHPENASLPIDLTLLGIVISMRFEHPENVKTSIDVTLLGIAICVRFEYPENV